jgi:hypothetical protein
MAKGQVKRNRIVTSVDTWKKSTAQRPLELPSGCVCLVKPIGVVAIMSRGLIPNPLLAIMTEAMTAAEKGKAAELDVDKLMADVIQDESKLKAMFDMADQITLACVLEPEVHAAPENEADRLEDLLYVDEVDMEDKMFIMNFAMGGSADLEPFREELARSVPAVPTE